MRLFKHSPFGVELSLALFPPLLGGGDRMVHYGKLELAGDMVLGVWSHGRVVLGLGGGGDFGRYWEGRGYPLITSRLSTVAFHARR